MERWEEEWSRSPSVFGMNILVYDRSPWKEEEKRKTEELGAKFVDSLEELMSKADIVSIHVPLTPETKHMIRMEHLKLLKPGAIIVNVARGAVIDGKNAHRVPKREKGRSSLSRRLHRGTPYPRTAS